MLVLFLSAYWEADIRWLHFFQSWMYVAAIALIWNRSKWGYFVGFGAALFWNYTTLFVNTFLKNGWEQCQILLHSGRRSRPDLFISVPAWAGNLAVLVGCLIGFLLGFQQNVERFAPMHGGPCCHPGILRADRGNLPTTLSASFSRCASSTASLVAGAT